MSRRRRVNGRLRKTTTGKDRHFRKTEERAGMTQKGVDAYKREKPR